MSTLHSRSEYPVQLDSDGGNTAICRFSCGRQRRNRRAQDAAWARRAELAQQLAATDVADLRRGFKSRMAKRFSVSRKTIANDLVAIRRSAFNRDPAPTPDQARADRWWEMLERMGIPVL